MRFLSALRNDMRYQAKYGFYFLYAFISAVYIAILFAIPPEHKKAAASIIILTDPAMLGMFFIGGIWLLEKEEGLHSYRIISPLKPIEYIASKAISLSVISTLSAVLIALVGLREQVNYLILSAGVLTGAFVFTIFGLIVASCARSVNHYMLIATPPATLLMLPAILVVFGITHPLFEILPGTVLWHLIAFSVGLTDKTEVWQWAVIFAWIVIALVLAGVRIPVASQSPEGGTQ